MQSASLLLLHRDARVPVVGGDVPPFLQLPPLPPAHLVLLHVPKAFLIGAAGPGAQLAESNISNGSSNVKRKHRIFRKVPEFSENFQYFQNFSKIFQTIVVDIVNELNVALARGVQGLKQYRFIYLV